MSKTKAFRRFLTVFLAVALLMSACAPAALASFKVKVFTNAKVYNVPSTSGKSLKVPKGLTLTVTATSGNWARVSYKGRTGYMPIPCLNLVNRPVAYTCKSTPVYKSPSTSSKIGTLSIGTAVYVVCKVGGFYRIQNKSGSVTGYVKGGYLTSKAKITAAYNAYKKSQSKKQGKSSGGSASSRLISCMNSLCGKPYNSSASIHNAPGSFNCSTFVRYVMGQFGISMKATASEQANDGRYKKITSISSLKLGDVLCFDSGDDGVCDHTAIYAGNGTFYEASQSAGKVHKNTFSAYYKEHFMWARRPK